MSTESIVHDQVNLLRLVRRLESDESQPERRVAHAQQSLQYARTLLSRLRQTDFHGPSTPLDFDQLTSTLDRLETTLQDTYNTPPKPRKSLLASLPKPKPKPTAQSQDSLDAGTPDLVDPLVNPAGLQKTAAAANSLLSAQDDSRPTFSPSTSPHNSFAASSSPANPSPPQSISSQTPRDAASHLTTSLQTQEELSAQLAQMAAQLKQNAIHFTDALAKDKMVMEGAEDKLQSNLTRMLGTQTKLKAHSGKSSSTTWLVLGAILAVCIAWVMMFFLIRIT